MAGRIPQRFIDDLLARIDIVELIDARVPLKKQGKEFAACCPFHSEKTPSFTVSPDKQFYHCFGCGAHGTALGFLMEYERLEFVDTVETLARAVGLEVPHEGGGAERIDTDLYGLMEKASQFYRQALRQHPPAIDYLKSRGVSGQIAADYGLGYAPATWDSLLRHLRPKAAVETLKRAGLVVEGHNGKLYDRFRDRVVFPIRDRQGRTVGFGGRILNDGQPKYLNSPETPLFHKGRALYGLHEARKAAAEFQRVLLVEGYMDVVVLAQHGIRNALATLGTATTAGHLQQVFRLTQEVVFCFDGDRAGREAAWRAVQNLLPVFHDGLEARFLFLPEGEDPDSFVRQHGPQALAERIDRAATLAEFLFARIESDNDGNTPAARARLAQRARPLLNKLPPGVFKQQMMDRLAERVGINPDGWGASGKSKGDAAARLRDRAGKRLSPVGTAIALLLNQPALAQAAPDTTPLKQMDLPGVGLLAELLETLRANPHLNSGSLVERYRDTQNGPHLLKLMTWEPPTSDDFDVAAEFQDAMAALTGRFAAQRTDALLQKARQGGLNDQEKAELRSLTTRPAQE